MQSFMCDRCGSTQLEREGDHCVCTHCGAVLFPDEGELGDAGGTAGENVVSGTGKMRKSRALLIGGCVAVVTILAVLLILLFAVRDVQSGESEIAATLEELISELEGTGTGEPTEPGFASGASEVGEPEAEAPRSSDNLSANGAGIVFPNDLTETRSFRGVTLNIDHAWETDEDDTLLAFFLGSEPASQMGLIAVYTYLDGQAQSPESFATAQGYNLDYTVLDAWFAEDVNYAIACAITSLGAEFYVLLGSVPDGTGFAVEFILGPDTLNDSNRALVQAVFDSVSFDPTAVTIDSQAAELGGDAV